ncbi:hypothetical protein GEMRC1_004033 [Eukaryota sp. GEM-RC1]
MSVLENHHASRASILLIKEENNFVNHLPVSQWNRFRTVLINCILGTDMGTHGKFLSNLNAVMKTCPLDVDPLSAKISCISSSPENRLLLCQGILKVSDISNPCRPFEIARTWAYQLIQEFIGQSETEQVHGLQSIIFPGGGQEIVNLQDLQVKFIEGVVLPLIEALSFFIMEGLQEMKDNAKKNVVTWKSL